MATFNHQPYHHSSTTTSSHRRPHCHSLDNSSLSSTTTSSSSLSLHRHHNHHTTTISLASTTTFSLSNSITTQATATTAAPDTAFSLSSLESHLASGNLRQADEETRRLLIVLAGDAAVKRGYVFFSEVQFIPTEDLKAIDDLWRKYSDNRFGYSIQKKIWLKANKDFTRFFIKVGWMKKLDTEVEQYNYRAFPNEFMWELNPTKSDDDGSSSDNNKGVPPEGHLPLTNALRGTQLLNCILTHPAFADEGEENRANGDDGGTVSDEQVGDDKKKSRFAALRDKLFKPNYSF